MMGVSLLNSVSETVSQRLDIDKEKWYFKARGGKDGLLIFKLLMQYSLQTTCYGSETTRDKLHSTLLDDIQAQGQVFHDDLFWAFKCLETVQQPVAFVRYIEEEKSEWEEGSDLTAAALCKFAETKFRHLLDAGKWTSSLVILLSDSKEKEDAKFIALVAVVKELAKSVSKTGEKNDTQKSK
jgi:hypothetical protein